MKNLKHLLFIFLAAIAFVACEKDDDDDNQLQTVGNPGTFVAVAGDQKIDLSWTKPSGNLARYSLSYTPGGVPISLDANTTTHTVENLTNGEVYIFTLKSVDGSGNLSSGVTASATPTDGSTGGTTGDNVFMGDITFTTQAELNAFDPKYTYIDGVVQITGPDIDDLTPLANVDSIEVLEIFFNDTLTSLEGLNKLKWVGDNLYLRGMDDLENLDALSNLVHIGKDISILDLDKITDLDGLSNLRSVRSLYIGTEAWKNPPKARSNSALSDYCGLKGLITSGTISGTYYCDNNLANPSTTDITNNCP